MGQAIRDTPNHRCLLGMVGLSIRGEVGTCGVVAVLMINSMMRTGGVTQKVFPNSYPQEALVDMRMPQGDSIGTTRAGAEKTVDCLSDQPETRLVSSCIGQAAPRFFCATDPERPDPAFARMVFLTPDAGARETLKHLLRAAAADGLASEADVQVTQPVFASRMPFPVEVRITGPDPGKLYDPSSRALAILRIVPEMRQPTRDRGNRFPVQLFVPDPRRLDLIALSPAKVAEQLRLLSTGIPLTYMHEDTHKGPVIGRNAGEARLTPPRS